MKDYMMFWFSQLLVSLGFSVGLFLLIFVIAIIRYVLDERKKK